METSHMIPPFFSGEKSHSLWETQRRPQILSLLAAEEYGISPGPDNYRVGWRITSEEDAMEGDCLRKLVDITVEASYGSFTFPFVLFLPKGEKPSPLVLFVNNREKVHTDPERRIRSGFWPVEEIIARGWAAAAFHTWDVETDMDDGFQNGIIRHFERNMKNRPPDAWATIAAWAFGASRIVDYLVTDPAVDKERIAVAGHSRGGKAALWCAAQDTRLYSAYSNCSGCSGAAVSRGKSGESIAAINNSFPFWFCENYKRYNNNEEALPFDQHMLLGLIAPRPLYVASASLDDWADPASEYKALRLASEIYELYGWEAVEQPHMPSPEQSIVRGRTGYHIRTGEHDLTPWDWQRYLDFLESQPESSGR